MPYQWTDPSTPDTEQELHLWPHQSLPPKGYVAFIGATFLLILVPLFPLLGTSLLWGLLPFLMAAVAGLWFALARSRKQARIFEVLRLTATMAHLEHHPPKGEMQSWDCNRYWASPQMHERDGPVPHYVTLKGGGREVEIGAFLSEEERVALFDELSRALRR